MQNAWKTYEDAINNILESIDLWIEDAQREGETIPQPRVAT
jgi:predicted RNase H-like HicB family nuclease